MRKTDIGKEAILRAAAALTERDELGVVAFNESAHWVVHTQPLGGVGDLQGAIAGIRPDGQTNIFSGLEAAVDELESATATRRHIILLTDGWSSRQYADLLERMAAAGITLSTVGAGGGSQNQFLSGLAEQGGALLRRREPGQHPRHLPQGDPAGLRAADRRGDVLPDRDLVVADPARPRPGLPQLRGYNGTTAKSAAQTVLVSARDDPLLAQWQYGLGRSVAWTSDSTGRWAADWVGWNGFNRFFSQLVSWTFPGEESGGIEASFVTEGNATKLRVESVESDGSPRDFFATSAAVVSPTLETDTLDLVQVAPGVYEQDLGEIEPGAYSVRVTQTRPVLRRSGGRWASSRRRPPSTGSSARTSRSSPRSVRQPAARRSRTSPRSGRTTTSTSRFTDVAAAARGRCCCGRSTSPSGVSIGAEPPDVAGPPAPDAAEDRATAGGGRRAPGRSRSGVFDKCPQRAPRRTGSERFGDHRDHRHRDAGRSSSGVHGGAERRDAFGHPRPPAEPAPPDATDTMSRLRDAKRRARER